MNTPARHICISFAALLLLGLAEVRAEPMYAYSAGAGNLLYRFDSSTPNTRTTVSITGLQGGEILHGLDLRPADGVLYAVTNQNRMYSVNPATGAATQVGSSGAFTLNGTAFGVDFNPMVDRLRVVSNTEQNLRLDPTNGTLAGADAALNTTGDIVAVAYSNNVAGAASTTLYAIDAVARTLCIITNPNAGGPITVVGSLGLNFAFQSVSFDISGLTGVAYAAISDSNVTHLYTVNLATGAATEFGFTFDPDYSGLTAATAVPEPSTYALLTAAACSVLCWEVRRVKKRVVAPARS
jgi:hypothetical protein